MSKRVPGSICATVDIGTSKICVLVARMRQDGHFEIIGIGKAVSDGLKKGVVVDVDRAVASIQKAVQEAELQAGIPIRSVSVGISGSHIHSVNSHGVGPISKAYITQEDIAHVLSAAKAIPINEGEQILHVLPQYFIIDGQEIVQNPLDMHGVRLEAEVHIIIGRVASVQNIVHCCHMAGLRVNDIILEQLASAYAVLTKDEQELGVALLDIGGGTSDVALYKHGNIFHTFVIPVAGNHFTNDLAIGLKTTIHEAERIKQEFGVASAEFLHSNSQIEMYLADDQHKKLINLSEVVRILEPRAQELLEIVYNEIKKKDLMSSMATGLVITGGGSLLSGISLVAELLFEVPVRIGRPRSEYGIPPLLDSPIYATGVGLLIQAFNKQAGHSKDFSDVIIEKGIFHKMKTWVTHFF